MRDIMNIVAFVGQIVDSPKLRESQQGNKFATMVVRIPRSFANSEGVYEQDDVSFTLWKGIAETTTNIAKEGDQVAIKGRLQSHAYETSDGSPRLGYDLIAEHVTFLNQMNHQKIKKV